ncbi:hypothetical protein WIS52_09760 [Pseudonocardia nematodicida]|uniref:Lipoprotein n=1 Tax=Pseudonocardia nematodicida TaxID=1206997 RepID=A0ABV1K8E3_9PSEU
MRERRALPRTRLLRSLTPLLLCAALLTGCAWGGPPGADRPPDAVSLPKYYDPAPLLTDVTNRMRTDVGAVVSVAGTLDGPGGPTPVTGDGALRYDGSGPDAGPAVRLTLRRGPEGDGGRSTGVVRAAARTWLQPPGADWAEIGRAPLPPDAVVDATVATNVAAGADPLAAVARYPDAVLVSDAVDDQVDGEPAVHYTLLVDLGRAIEAEPDEARRDALAAQQRAGSTRLSAELWLDADQRPIRGRIRQQLPDAGTVDLLTRYRDWGEPVVVEPPVVEGS